MIPLFSSSGLARHVTGPQGGAHRAMGLSFRVTLGEGREYRWNVNGNGHGMLLEWKWNVNRMLIEWKWNVNGLLMEWKWNVNGIYQLSYNPVINHGKLGNPRTQRKHGGVVVRWENQRTIWAEGLGRSIFLSKTCLGYTLW